MKQWYVIGEDRYTSARMVQEYVEADTRLKAIHAARRKAGLSTTAPGGIRWTVLKWSAGIASRKGK